MKMDVKAIIDKIKWRIETASHIAGKGADGKAYEDLEQAIDIIERSQRLIDSTLERIAEMQDELYGGPERPSDLVDCGMIDGEYNALIGILDAFGVEYDFPKDACEL